MKDDALYFGHMLDVARKAVDKTSHTTRVDYDKDENLRLALAHLVQMIGEAARLVSPRGRSQLSSIPWREITGMRHKIVHDYLNVDEDIAWTVVTVDLPELIRLLESAGIT